jgi:putative glutamine amidotransferase
MIPKIENIAKSSFMKERTIPFLFLLALLLPSCSHKTVVGIAETCTGRSAVAGRSYVEAVARGGNVPLVIPDNEYAGELLKKIDILLLIGGEDVNPSYYGAEPSPNLGAVNGRRDTFEMKLIQEAIKHRIPIFGICRGEQVLNVAFGGTLIQHLLGAEKHMSLPTKEDNIHRVLARQESFAARIYGAECTVNSSHHQGIEHPGKGLSAAMVSEDGVIEALEHDSLPVWSVQWHPERMCFSRRRNDTADGSLIFRFFLEQCRSR